MDTLEFLDFIGYIVEIILCAVWVALSFSRTRKRIDKSFNWFFYLMAGFFACICLSDLFYVLTWVVEDYPFVFSPGDLSWVGGYLFLITIAAGLQDTLPPQARKKYRVPALIAPAVCAVFTIAYILIYPDIVFNYLLYGIPMAALAYYALWLLLADGRKGKMRPFYLAILVWLGTQLFYDLFNTLGWSYGYAVPALVSGWAMVLAGTGVWFGARKGAEA